MKWCIHLLLLLTGMQWSSCAKDKIDKNNLITYNEVPSSTARFVFVKNLDIEINNKKLSNWEASRVSEVPKLPPIPTAYFPATGKPGDTYFVPREFINAQGTADVRLYFAGGQNPFTTVTVKDSHSDPQDYYLFSENISLNPVVKQIPRPSVKPSSPENILIRLVNLSSVDGLNCKPNEGLSLTYANGMAVSLKTSGIVGGERSEYVEIPYGTYDFHVLVEGTSRQCPTKQVISGGSINGPDDFTLEGTNLYFTQRRLFQAGGVYTIAVSLDYGSYQYDLTPVALNVFTVIADLTPAANTTYAKVQVANALRKDGITATIDGKSHTIVQFGKATDHQVLISGKHLIEIKDNSGKVLGQTETTVKAGDNFTIWVYPKTDETAGFTTSQNNMSGIINGAANPDGADGSTFVYDPLNGNALNVQTRFLNFCPELANVTFTGRNGQPFRGSTQIIYDPVSTNIQFGRPVSEMLVPYPYINLLSGYIEAYQSTPVAIPGNRLGNVLPLSDADFINMPSFQYPYGMPSGEPGVYTVALIGHYTSNEHPVLVVIKHNL